MASGAMETHQPKLGGAGGINSFHAKQRQHQISLASLNEDHVCSGNCKWKESRLH